MVSQAEQLDYQADIDAVVTLAFAALVDEIGDPTRVAPERAARLIREIVPLIVAEYGAQAAAVSADFYDEIRAAALAGALGYTATLGPQVTAEAVQEQLGWALAPLFATDLNPADTLGRIAGKVQAFVSDAGRDTVAWNAANDPVGTTYARHASANACAFCRMLATRGDAYLSEESATRVVGEIDPRTGAPSRAPRGDQPLGEKYHDNCRCIAVPVFPGDAYEPAPYVAEWEVQYAEAARRTGTTRADVPALLATWRDLYGTR